MDKRVTVLTIVPPMYRLYPEFQLCLKMFREALPEGSSLVEQEGDDGMLRVKILEHLVDAAPYVLIVKEPAVIMGKGTVEELLRVMEENQNICCVLPSDVLGYRGGKATPYYTLRGFERFTESLRDPGVSHMPYDGRPSWMFLARREALSRMAIPADPLNIPRLLPADEVCISLNAYIHPFIDYDLATARAEILPLVPENITSLLDIGCHTGKFGALAREKFGCRVVGSEINPQAAEIAKRNLDGVIGDILTTAFAEKFDCVTCLDVLEHVRETGLFLRKVRDLLNENGYLLLSVPNVGHWSIVEDLLAGRWDYIPAGTLCITHLRFFTKKTIEAALRDAGFEILSVKEEPVPPPSPVADAIALLERSGTDIDGKSLFTLSYYILARKRED
ncbi:MAG TPA: class I SAM-dependent methyltransferase [Thermodesulfovibrionales bacterium]|nr:class I SAM-dependent methyltransferase [Thermodesulfovibrionales bacterium]